MNKSKKFHRKIGKEFVHQTDLHNINPDRALKMLKKLRDRSLIMDARTVRQGDGMQPVVLSLMEHRAIKAAIKLLRIRKKLLHPERKTA